MQQLLTPVLGLLGIISRAGFVSAKPPGIGGGIIALNGTSVGHEQVYNGGEKKSDTAVLYLTDVYGINLTENRLLADSFGRAGYLTVAPDLFNGTPSPVDMNDPGFNITEFLATHGPNATDPLVDVAIKYLKDEVGVKKIAATGYCFGGRYAFRFVAEGKGADAAFAAHPSLLEDDEIAAIAGPLSMAAAENDSMMPPDRRNNITAQLGLTDLPYSVALYSGTSHGFGVRINTSDPQQVFGKETAFYQAVNWFDSWA
ncbi:dienelactone hydrolase [Xylariales sp. PMI_506]|nr:dienelactone hydrolase [Xylariales sp. PMI_506]